MKLKKEFFKRTIGDEEITAVAEEGAFGGIARNSETAAFIIDRLQQDTTPETIIADMYAEYDAPIGVIAADAERILNILRGVGALED